MQVASPVPGVAAAQRILPVRLTTVKAAAVVVAVVTRVLLPQWPPPRLALCLQLQLVRVALGHQPPTPFQMVVRARMAAS
jgi:hypothetical protein